MPSGPKEKGNEGEGLIAAGESFVAPSPLTALPEAPDGELSVEDGAEAGADSVAVELAGVEPEAAEPEAAELAGEFKLSLAARLLSGSSADE
ncbi:MAG: hypothetical protein IPP57_18220 [Candidatus Obscuribacter sp.]|nr:hypothetical protein [Candidatus Obscuribacter sp.]MBK7841221.1 hypothetical protein [Candidatus Obscuribacter sp.]MBK9619711.1 hypothetical protein [Candidatus Obscuribacter sp.]MBK9772723.1 hypothetical protein [Candidatus Obscuribacter sp.]